jgi:hypothetical protein
LLLADRQASRRRLVCTARLAGHPLVQNEEGQALRA